MNEWPTLEELQRASETGNIKYTAQQAEELSSCLRSWRTGILIALRSVVENNSRTYRVSVAPGGSYSVATLRAVHSRLKEEVLKEIPGIDIQHDNGSGFFVVTWDREQPIF